MILPADVVLIPPEFVSPIAVREYIDLDGLARQHPQHELFVVWNRVNREESFAFVIRIHKNAIARGADPGIYFERETRVLEITKALNEPIGEEGP